MRRFSWTLVLCGLWLGGAWALAGETAAKPPEGDSGGFLKWLADNPFSATLIFLILATLLGAVIARLTRDRCLKDFEGYPVTLELKDGRVYHGELDVEKSGLEFLYERTTPQEGITKTSFLIFRPEYATVHALVRYHDALSREQLREREKRAQKAYHPNFIRRSARATRNFLASVKDSLLEAFSLVMGRVKSIQAAAPVMKTGGKYVDRIGKQTIGTASDVTYDPLLEKQIGLRVVLQLPKDAAVQEECVGTFREYTKDFFELMDVDYEDRWEAQLPGAGSAAFVRGIATQRTPQAVHIENCNTFAVELEAATFEAAEGQPSPPAPPVPAKLESGHSLELPVPEGAGALSLTFHSQRKADIVVPRAGAFVRHKSEWVQPRKLIGELKDAVGLLPGTQQVINTLRQGAQLVSPGTRRATIPFVKMHGCGNDYVYVDCRERVVEDPPALARRLSDRHFGIGADGLILILPSERADFRMRIFNADGSEAEMCGNGIRCFAKYLYDRRLITSDQAQIETGAGVLTVRILPQGAVAKAVTVNMGTPHLERADIPIQGPPGRAVDEELTIEVPHEGNLALRYTAVSMGNPHCVIFVERVDDFPVATYGPLVENHRLFPNRTNAEFVQVVARNELKMRVWERGSGETLACGTGACASLVAAVLNGKADRRATVHLLGGDLEIEWAEDGCVYLTGPAEEVFEGMVEV